MLLYIHPECAGGCRMITLDFFIRWFDSLDTVFKDNKEYLTQLDAAIGDADHGINVSRGFSAVAAAIRQKPSEDISSLFKTVSMTLIRTVGGASGPLLGTFFIKLASQLPEDTTVITSQQFYVAMLAGADGIARIGKSIANEKTMLDALYPALDAMKQSIQSGRTISDILTDTANAARTGAEATIPMLATKGRASYLGERSIGHQDPGATTIYLMLNTATHI